MVLTVNSVVKLCAANTQTHMYYIHWTHGWKLSRTNHADATMEIVRKLSMRTTVYIVFRTRQQTTKKREKLEEKMMANNHSPFFRCNQRKKKNGRFVEIRTNHHQPLTGLLCVWYKEHGAVEFWWRMTCLVWLNVNFIRSVVIILLLNEKSPLFAGIEDFDGKSHYKVVRWVW